MSLFPAYTGDNTTGEKSLETSKDRERSSVLWSIEEATPAEETSLLASSSSDDDQITELKPARSATPPDEDFYLDTSLDRGNLRVSTLYYPGRPEYKYDKEVLGYTRRKRRGARPERYFLAPRRAEPAPDVAARVSHYQRALVETPHDEEMWLQFVHFQEWSSGWEASAATCEAALCRLPHSVALRRELRRALREALTPHQYMERLRNDIRKESDPVSLSSLWLSLLDGASDALSAGELTRLAGAALAEPTVGRQPDFYPRLLHQYASYLVSADLWEQLSLLTELVLAMNLPPSPHFPPPPDKELVAREERRLIDIEDKAINCGLPLSTVWSRVELARAAVHWRGGGGAGGTGGDPQRAPLPHDVAPLLVPVTAPQQLERVVVALLNTAGQVPLLPCGLHTWPALGETLPPAGGARLSALLAVLHAARRLPPAHPARPTGGVAARLLARFTTPPHTYVDGSYSRWVDALWRAACAWQGGGAVGGGAAGGGAGFACWRLRYLNARAVLCADKPDEEPYRSELSSIMSQSRETLRLCSNSVAYALHARLAHTCGSRRAMTIAGHALRAARGEGRYESLFAARVLGEIATSRGEPGGPRVQALCSAVLGGEEPPSRDVLREAERVCEEQCAQLEALYRRGGVPDNEPGPLVCGAGEWGAARGSLVSPARRDQLWEQLQGDEGLANNTSMSCQRYLYQSLCSLRLSGVTSPLRDVYRGALLQLWEVGAPLWRGGGRGAREAGDAGAAGGVLVELLRAEAALWNAQECRRVLRALQHVDPRCVTARRAALLAEPTDVPRVVQRAPASKWSYVWGACGGGDARALSDALLERELRLRALPDELIPLAVPAAPTQ